MSKTKEWFHVFPALALAIAPLPAVSARNAAKGAHAPGFSTPVFPSAGTELENVLFDIYIAYNGVHPLASHEKNALARPEFYELRTTSNYLAPLFEKALPTMPRPMRNWILSEADDPPAAKGLRSLDKNLYPIIAHYMVEARPTLVREVKRNFRERTRRLKESIRAGEAIAEKDYFSLLALAAEAKAFFGPDLLKKEADGLYEATQNAYFIGIDAPEELDPPWETKKE